MEALDVLEATLVRVVKSELKEIEKRKGRKPDYGKAATRQQVLDAYEALKTSLTAFQQAADADLACLLQRELLACVDLYGDLKTRAGALDFLDLLLKARDLVRDCAPVRRAFQDRFRYILVDEFQDTDPLQAEILMLLAGEEGSQDAGARLQAPGCRPRQPGARSQTRPGACSPQPAARLANRRDQTRGPLRRRGPEAVDLPVP